MAWICDIDGTVAINTGRSPYDWAAVSSDAPNKPVITVVRALAAKTTIIFMSGRMEQCRSLTRQWLHTYVCDPATELCSTAPLLMRRDGDTRPDQVIKRELFKRRVQGLFEVEGVIDDRSKVVRMWREQLGLTCLQVAPGDF
jgi:hypothetical protein